MNDTTYAIRYLLGELSEDEQAELEERYVDDPRIFDEIARAESDLVDDYVRGKLAPEARERFERVYLAHSRRRDRLKFVEALLTRLDRAETAIVAAPSAGIESAWRTWLDRMLRPRPAFGFAFAILLIASGVWLALEARRTRQEAVQREAARTNQERRDREAEARASAEKAGASQAATRRPPTVVVLALNAGAGARAVEPSSPTPLVIFAGISEVRLQLSLPPLDYPSYRVILRSVGGAEIFRRGDLRAAAAGPTVVITLDVPASAFESSDYTLTLQGATTGGGFEDVSRLLIRADKR